VLTVTPLPRSRHINSSATLGPPAQALLQYPLPLPPNPATAGAAASAVNSTAAAAAAAAASAAAPARSHLDISQLLHTGGSAGGNSSGELPPLTAAAAAAAAAAGSGSSGSARVKDETFAARHQHQYSHLPAQQQHEHARTGMNYAAAAGHSDTQQQPQGKQAIVRSLCSVRISCISVKQTQLLALAVVQLLALWCLLQQSYRAAAV
jgi:hypothetical protein